MQTTAHGSDRRAHTRYESHGLPALLEWLHDGAPRTMPAFLRDVSLRGALVLAEAEPAAANARVKLYLPSSSAPAPVRAVVVGSTPPRRTWLGLRGGRGWLVRLAFAEVCPYEFFKAAADGFVSETSPVAEFQCEGFDYRDWR